MPQNDNNFTASEQHNKTVSEFIIFDGRRAVSIATVKRRTIALNAHTYSIGELDNVFTDARYRRRGLARRNITAATTHIRRCYDFGVLLCDANMGKFYNKFGWRVVESPAALQALGVEKISNSRRVMVDLTLRSTIFLQ